MKNILKFMRSIITSLSFLVIIILLILCIITSVIKKYNRPLNEYINIDTLIKTYTDNNLLINSNYYNITYTYIDDYINYIFYKNDYPSISEHNNKTLTSKEKKDLEKLKNQIDLSYLTILKIREASNFLTNSSIHFIIKSFILVLFLVVCVLHMNINRGIFIFSKALIISGVFSLLIIVLINELFLKIPNIFVQSIFVNLIDISFLKEYFSYSIIYMIAGYVLWVIEIVLLCYYRKTKKDFD